MKGQLLLEANATRIVVILHHYQQDGALLSRLTFVGQLICNYFDNLIFDSCFYFF